MTNEFAIAATESMNGIFQIIAAVTPIIAEAFVSASARTCR